MRSHFRLRGFFALGLNGLFNVCPDLGAHGGGSTLFALPTLLDDIHAVLYLARDSLEQRRNAVLNTALELACTLSQCFFRLSLPMPPVAPLAPSSDLLGRFIVPEQHPHAVQRET